jgi:hypothetical protein
MPERNDDLSPEPLTHDLGAHTLTIGGDDTITIEDHMVAVLLYHDEAYKLLIVLQEVFK